MRRQRTVDRMSVAASLPEWTGNSNDLRERLAAEHHVEHRRRLMVADIRLRTTGNDRQVQRTVSYRVQDLKPGFSTARRRRLRRALDRYVRTNASRSEPSTRASGRERSLLPVRDAPRPRNVLRISIRAPILDDDNRAVDLFECVIARLLHRGRQSCSEGIQGASGTVATPGNRDLQLHR